MAEIKDKVVTVESLSALHEYNKEMYATKMDIVSIAVESEEYKGCYYRTVDGETEWINPPMLESVEYRTTERYLGKPVFTTVFYISEIRADYFVEVFIEGSSPITLTKATTNGCCVVEYLDFKDNGGEGDGNVIRLINEKDQAITNVIVTVKYVYNN